MSGIADWIEWNVPVRLTSSTRFHESRVTSRNGSNQVMPALVTRISIGPSSRRTASMAASTDERSATSQRRAMALPPIFSASRFRRVSVDVEHGDTVTPSGQMFADRSPHAATHRR